MNRHAEQVPVVAQLLDGWRHQAKVLGDERHVNVVQRRQEGSTGDVNPFTRSCVGGIAGDGPRPNKTDEVVETDHVDQLSQPGDALVPPSKAFLHMGGPGVDRVAPELTRVAKDVRRHTRSLLGSATFIQLKQVGSGPHVHGILCHVERHVPDDQHLRLRSGCLDGLPRSAKGDLHGGVVAQPGLVHRHIEVQAGVSNRKRPNGPGCSMNLPKGLEHGKASQPWLRFQSSRHLRRGDRDVACQLRVEAGVDGVRSPTGVRGTHAVHRIER